MGGDKVSGVMSMNMEGESGMQSIQDVRKPPIQKIGFNTMSSCMRYLKQPP
jgi:hypothetical protein